MRSVLFTVGPWPLWVYPVIVIVISLVLALWRRIEVRIRGEATSLSPTGLPTTAAAVLVVAALLYLLVNRLGPVYVHGYGVMLIVALTAGISWLAVTSRAHGIPAGVWIDFALFILIGGVLGARLLFIALNWDQYASAPLQILQVWQGGLAYHGGVVGGLASAYLFSRVYGIDFTLLADLGAPATALGYSLARIGCFLNGCCYGRAASPGWPLGMVFPPGSDAGEYAQAPVHPTQLYASFASIVIFYILCKAWPHVKARGNLFLLYLVLYSIYRFLIEFLRRGATAKVFAPVAPLTEAQVASIAIGTVALIWMLIRRKRM